MLAQEIRLGSPDGFFSWQGGVWEWDYCLLAHNIILFEVDLIPCRPVVFNTSNLFNLPSLSLSISIHSGCCHLPLKTDLDEQDRWNTYIMLWLLTTYNTTSAKGLGVKFGWSPKAGEGGLGHVIVKIKTQGQEAGIQEWFNGWSGMGRDGHMRMYGSQNALLWVT